ncbi:hypothetical protein Pelo_14907 [Pelomyxa schiedti]|nr:hypothetical protein Pelo_14907 [Pelomyxa schiedti]
MPFMSRPRSRGETRFNEHTRRAAAAAPRQPPRGTKHQQVPAKSGRFTLLFFSLDSPPRKQQGKKMQERNSRRRQRAQQATITRTQIRATCQDQFAALLASSHPRCGAASPARHLAAVSPLMRHLWAAAVVAPARWFVLAPVRFSEASWCVALAVSPATLGVLRGPEVTPSHPLSMWLGPGACLALETGAGPEVQSMALVPAPRLVVPGMPQRSAVPDPQGKWARFPRGDDEFVPPRGVRYTMLLDANYKWVVDCFGYLGTLSITKLLHHDAAGGTSAEGGVGVVAGTTVAVQLPTWFPRLGRAVLNKVDPDEALLQSYSNGDCTAYFILVDVPLSHSTQSLQVLSVTKLNFPEGLNSVCAPLILRKSNGDPVFVIPTKRNEINLVEASTGVKSLLSSDCFWPCLSQVSASVFCTWHGSTKSCTMWDCNNSAQPLWTVRSTSEGLCLKHVVGGSGFLFAVGDDKIEVMDALSGSVLMSIEPSFGTHMIHPGSSLLWGE